MESFTWINLIKSEDIENIITDSFFTPSVLFKHSTRCSISSIAKHRLETDGQMLDSPVKFYYLDLIAHRDLSTKISEKFHVPHESPQILVIKNGDCILEASHLDIHVSEISEVL